MDYEERKFTVTEKMSFADDLGEREDCMWANYEDLEETFGVPIDLLVEMACGRMADTTSARGYFPVR